MVNKFNKGEVVRAIVNPTLELVVMRYVHKIYYCKIQVDPDHRELAYFERELLPQDLKNIKKIRQI
jgi:hypothetical protein